MENSAGLALIVFSLCAAFAAAPAEAQRPVDENVCEAVASGVDAVFALALKEASNVPLREQRVFAGRFPQKRQGGLRKPEALPRVDWRAFDRIDIADAPAECKALQHERFGFAFGGEDGGASVIRIMDLKKSETESEFLMRLSLANDPLGHPDGPSSLFVTLVAANENGDWHNRIYHIFKVFRSGNGFLTQDCRNPDDFDDCLTDVNF